MYVKFRLMESKYESRIQLELKDRFGHGPNRPNPTWPVLLLLSFHAIGQLVVTHAKEMPAFQTGKRTQIWAITPSSTINMAAWADSIPALFCWSTLFHNNMLERWTTENPWGHVWGKYVDKPRGNEISKWGMGGKKCSSSTELKHRVTRLHFNLL